MSWTEFKKFSGIVTLITAILAVAMSALALSLSRADVDKTNSKEEGAIKAIVEEHGKSLTRIETKLDTLLLKQAK